MNLRNHVPRELLGYVSIQLSAIISCFYVYYVYAYSKTHELYLIINSTALRNVMSCSFRHDK